MTARKQIAQTGGVHALIGPQAELSAGTENGALSQRDATVGGGDLKVATGTDRTRPTGAQTALA